MKVIEKRLSSSIENTNDNGEKIEEFKTNKCEKLKEIYEATVRTQNCVTFLQNKNCCFRNACTKKSFKEEK